MYVKVIDIDFETGHYSVETSEPFSALDEDIIYYYTVGLQFLLNQDGTLAETFIFGTSLGLDNDQQSVAWALGFVTSVSDASRINPLLDASNQVSFFGQSSAASSGFLEDTIAEQTLALGELDQGDRLRSRRLQDVSHILTVADAMTYPV